MWIEAEVLVESLKRAHGPQRFLWALTKARESADWYKLTPMEQAMRLKQLLEPPSIHDVLAKKYRLSGIIPYRTWKQ